MKRVFSLLTALALCAGLALPALAETPTPTPTATPAPTETPAAGVPAAGLASDAYIVTAGVTSPTGGELTTIKKGDTFNVIVQVADPASDSYGLQQALDARGDAPAENFISARVSSPSFQHSGTAEVSPSYLSGPTDFTYEGCYRYTLIFRDVTWLGGDNTFSFDVSYPRSLLAWKSLSFAIGQCTTADKNGDGTPDGDADLTPHLMVRSSSYGNQLINAGTPFTLSVLVYATKGNESLDDVTVTLDLRSEGVSLAGGTLSQYIGTMKANSTQEVYFTILPSVSFTGGVADIGVSLQGFGAETGTEANGSVSISVPIEQPDRFEITGMELSDTIYIGDSASITVSFVNKGRNPISNLEASISGMNLGAELTQQYLGNLAAGTENSVDFDLAPTEEGPVTGTVTLTYEAADGTLKTVVQEFSATAVMMMYEDPGMMGDMPSEEPEPQSTGLPLWGWLLIGAAVIGGIVAAVVLVRRRRKAKAMASLEADDEDF